MKHDYSQPPSKELSPGLLLYPVLLQQRFVQALQLHVQDIFLSLTRSHKRIITRGPL